MVWVEPGKSGIFYPGMWVCGRGVWKRDGGVVNGGTAPTQATATDGATRGVLFSIQLLLPVTCGTNISFGPWWGSMVRSVTSLLLASQLVLFPIEPLMETHTQQVKACPFSLFSSFFFFLSFSFSFFFLFLPGVLMIRKAMSKSS